MRMNLNLLMEQNSWTLNAEMHLTWMSWYKLYGKGSSVDFCTGSSTSENERQRNTSVLHLCCGLGEFLLVGGREREKRGNGAERCFPFRLLVKQHCSTFCAQGPRARAPPSLNVLFSHSLSCSLLPLFVLNRVRKFQFRFIFIMLLFLINTVTFLSVLSVFRHCCVSVQKKKEINNWMTFRCVQHHGSQVWPISLTPLCLILHIIEKCWTAVPLLVN